MSASKNQALANAQKLAQRGLFDKAIKAYRSVAEQDPDDIRIWLKIGDLYSRKGAVSDAVETYTKVANVYVGKGFFLKAVAVYKQILDVDPTLLDVHRKLGDVYIKINLMQEAMAQYQLVVGSLERDGRHAEGLDLLKRMVELSPNNEPNHLRLAEALARDCENEAAVEQFRHVLGRMKTGERVTEYIKVAERLLYLYPDENDVAQQLSECYLRTRNVARALHWLQLLFKSDNSDTRTLELLARAFTQIGKNDRAVQVLRELTRLYEVNGNDKRRRRCFEKILALDPNDAEARGILQDQGSDPDQGQSIIGQSSILGTDLGFEANLSTEERVDLCLSDVELLVKYGLIDHARQRLDVVFGIDSDNIRGLEQLRDLCLIENKVEDAVKTLIRLAQLTKDADPAKARKYLQEAGSHQPDHTEVRQLLAALGQQKASDGMTAPSIAPAPPARPAMDASVSMDDSGEFDLSLDLDLGDLGDLELEVDDFGDLSADASEFELSLDGFDMDDLGFEVDELSEDSGQVDDDFADLLSADPETTIDNSLGGVTAPPIVLAPPPPSVDAPSTVISSSQPDLTDSADIDLSSALLDATMENEVTDLSADFTSEHAPLDLSDFDDFDLDQAAMDAAEEIDDEDDFGGLLVSDEHDDPNGG